MHSACVGGAVFTLHRIERDSRRWAGDVMFISLSVYFLASILSCCILGSDFSENRIAKFAVLAIRFISL